MKINKTFTSETAHIVRNAFSERCKFNIHGHSYKWEISIEGIIDEKTGMVLDFKLLKPIGEIIDMFDHTTVLWSEEKKEIKDFFINNFQRVLIMIKNPTAENFAELMFKMTNKWLKNEFPNLKVNCIKVWETENSFATCDYIEPLSINDELFEYNFLTK